MTVMQGWLRADGRKGIRNVVAVGYLVECAHHVAREIALRQPAATTVACVDAGHAQRLQDACTTSFFRPYWTTDVVGTEIGGSVKNVIALAYGMATAMGMGDNTKASLITRGLAEMRRLVPVQAGQALLLGVPAVMAGYALLRLGQSLAALGQTPEACVTLKEVGVRFPGSDQAAQATTSMQGLACQ